MVVVRHRSRPRSQVFRRSDLRTAIARLQTISAHDALFLLQCNKPPTYLRCIPCDGHPLLGMHDDLLRDGVSAICNSHIGHLRWIQASLPVREGRLRIRRVSSLALSAFLASDASTSELQTIIVLNFPSGLDNTVHEARVRWCSINNLPCLGDECSGRQRS